MKTNILLFLLTGVSLVLSGAEIVSGGRAQMGIYVDKLTAKPYPRQYDPAFRAKRLKSRAEHEDQLLANAVDDLNFHLQKISGCTLPVKMAVPAKDIVSGIVIGSAAAELGCTLPENESSPEAFRLRTDGKRILIYGRSKLALSHGIYALLRKLGCEWVMPGETGEILPVGKNVVLQECDVISRPDFKRRIFWYGGFCRDKKARYEFDIWMRRMQIPLPCFTGNDFVVRGHVWHNLIKKYKKEFEKDPSMYALVLRPDGSKVRQGPQIETTHPRVIELAIEYIRDIFVQNKWPKDKRVCIPLGPADGGNISVSPETAATGTGRINPDSGKPDGTDAIVHFLNTILERTEKEFPNLHLGFFLYSWHADYPVKNTPHPRIAINVADINFSRFHGSGDPVSRSRHYFRSIMEKWGEMHKKQGNVIEYRPYSYNLADGWMPFSKLKAFGDDIPFMKKLGAEAFMLNAYNDWAVNGAHTYLAARLSWDSSLDWKKVLRDYCIASYGKKPAQFMEQYFLAVTRRQIDAGQEAGGLYAYPLIYDKAFSKAMRELGAKASAAAENGRQRELIRIAMLPMDNLDNYLDFRKAIGEYDFPRAAALYKEAMAAIDRELKNNPHVLGVQGKKFYGRFFQKYITESLRYSTAPAKIVYRLPEKMKTALDPEAYGEKLNYYGTAVNDSNYIITSTWNSTFDAQGLGLYRSGAVWYRQKFKLPADSSKPDGFSYILVIGGADNMVRVWCNGRFVGGSSGPEGLCTPRIFDLGDTVREGEENLLAVQVIRFGNFELGTGGIMLPSFISCAPALKNSRTDEVFDVLPGGIIQYRKKSK